MKPSHEVTYCDIHDEWSSYKCCPCNCLTPKEARKVWAILNYLSLSTGINENIEQELLDKLRRLADGE